MTDAALGKEELRALLSSPVDVAELLGLTYQRTGPDSCKVICPAHDDHRPSCSLFRGDRGMRAFCFVCGFSADEFGFIAQVRGLDVRKDFRAVLDAARELAGASAVGQHALAGRPREARPRRPQHVLTDERYHQIAYTWLQLCGALEAGYGDAGTGLGQRYLQSRELAGQAALAGVVTLPEECDERGVREILGQLRGNRDRRVFSDEELGEDGGASITENGTEFLWPWHLVAIPWVSPEGAITCVQRRNVDGDEPRYVFPKGRSPQHPFGIECLRQDPNIEVVIVEGALDVLARRELARMHAEDIDVLGIPSASTPLVGLPVDALADRRVVVATDNDDAGHRAASALHQALHGHVRALVREVPTAPGATDWGDELLSHL